MTETFTMRNPIIGAAASLIFMTGLAAGCSTNIGEDIGHEKWNRQNNPAHVDDNFKYNVGELPLTGQSKLEPIPADYWATYHDSINATWDGDSPSPATKFGEAFGIDGLEDIISRNYGIDKYRGSRKSCKTSSDCSDLEDGSSCSRRAGEVSDPDTEGYVDGVCIPSWWGICHGWAPYAISEPAAVNPVEHNGVTFYPGDIEALMSLVYGKGLRVKFLSERCNEKAPDPDEDGRIPEDECRDMNPGSLHVVATNMLGIRGQGFVEDRTYDLQVWNQPVKGYDVTNATEDGKLKEVTKAEAIALLDAEGETYTYNTDAKRFFHVKLALHWITEAPPSQSSHVGESAYTRTDNYEYILETDADGNIMGGEYVGSSRTNHPDFVWWPTAKPNGWVAEGKVTYEDVAMLNAKAAAGGSDEPSGDEPVANGCSHNECQTGEKLVSDCSPCATTVCELDPYCCDTEWDSYCIDEARNHASCGCE